MIVDKIDDDKDGFVTEAELKAWIKRAQKRYIFENVGRQWPDFDSNQDGLVSWEEYRNVTYGYYMGKEQQAGQWQHANYCGTRIDDRETDGGILVLTYHAKQMIF